jgi:hypothetical protein
VLFRSGNRRFTDEFVVVVASFMKRHDETSMSLHSQVVD